MRPLLVAIIVAGVFAQGGAAVAQTTQPAPVTPVTEVRQTAAEARKEMEAYKAAGGAAGATDDPAVKWDAVLWAYRDKYPRTDAAAIGAAEAVRVLVRAELWSRAQARIEALDFQDPAWTRVAAIVYEQGIARKDLPSAIATLTRAAESTTDGAIKSSVLLVLGRAYRRHGDLAAATRTLEAAKAAAPGTPAAEDADGLIYEIKYLSIGLQAPAISGKPRNARRAITLESFPGKPIVIVFWGGILSGLHGGGSSTQRAAHQYANQAVILGISIDTELARTDRTIKEKGMVWPVLATARDSTVRSRRRTTSREHRTSGSWIAPATSSRARAPRGRSTRSWARRSHRGGLAIYSPACRSSSRRRPGIQPGCA